MCFYTFHRFNMENQIGGTATATLGNEMKPNKTGLQACCLNPGNQLTHPNYRDT